MTTTAYFRYSKVLRRVHEGPLGVHIDTYAARLLREGLLSERSALAKVAPMDSAGFTRYLPGDQLLQFLNAL